MQLLIAHFNTSKTCSDSTAQSDFQWCRPTSHNTNGITNGAQQVKQEKQEAETSSKGRLEYGSVIAENLTLEKNEQYRSMLSSVVNVLLLLPSDSEPRISSRCACSCSSCDDDIRYSRITCRPG